MNGFSVCNKLKKDPALKEVPLIIMSSESSDETFEQHRKLRTRAEDYVHKPIAFGELLDHINTFVKLGGGIEQAQSEGQIVIEDEIQLDGTEMDDEGTQIAHRPPAFGGVAAHKPIEVDPDIEAFADAAFGALTGDAGEKPPVLMEPTNGAHAVAASEPPPRRASVPQMPAAPPPVPARAKTGSVPAIPIAPRSPSQPPPRPGVDPAELERAKGETKRPRRAPRISRGSWRARRPSCRARRKTRSARARTATKK